MRGFVITLIPKDASGVKRNQEFYEEMKEGLPGGGKAEIKLDGVVKCVWDFKMSIPSRFAKKISDGFTKPLNQAKRETDNFDFKVEFI